MSIARGKVKRRGLGLKRSPEGMCHLPSQHKATRPSQARPLRPSGFTAAFTNTAKSSFISNFYPAPSGTGTLSPGRRRLLTLLCHVPPTDQSTGSLVVVVVFREREREREREDELETVQQFNFKDL